MSRYDLVILSLFHPRTIPGGAQQCAHDLFLNLRKYSDLSVCFIGATSPQTELVSKPSSFLRKVPGAEDEYYFFTGEYDYFWHRCLDARPINDLLGFVCNAKPRSVFVSHYMHIGIDFLALLRIAMPDVYLAVGLHEMLFACLADGQMVRKTDGGLCRKAEPELCTKCFPHVSADMFMARHKFNAELLDMADAYIVPAQHLGAQLRLEMGIDAQKIHVINHPIDLDRYPSEINSQPDQTLIRFGYFGQFLDNKGIHLLLMAGEHLDQKQPHRHFEIVCNGGNRSFASLEYRQKVEAMIENSRQWRHGQVIDQGGYTHDELMQRMAGVDVVVVPSTWPEVFALVVTEAFACGKPVIAACIGGLAERVEDGVNGYNFTARDCISLAEKMELFIDMSNQRYRTMAQACRNSAAALNPKRALAQYYKALALQTAKQPPIQATSQQSNR